MTNHAIDAIRQRRANRDSYDIAQWIADFDYLVTALDSLRNDVLSLTLQRDQALRERDDRARMLSVVQDALTQRNRENGQLLEQFRSRPDQEAIDMATSRAVLAERDSALLDKLPNCFHMLRYARGYWHLTYATNKQYATVREAIDAHVEPGAQPLRKSSDLFCGVHGIDQPCVKYPNCSCGGRP